MSIIAEQGDDMAREHIDPPPVEGSRCSFERATHQTVPLPHPAGGRRATADVEEGILPAGTGGVQGDEGGRPPEHGPVPVPGCALCQTGQSPGRGTPHPGPGDTDPGGPGMQCALRVRLSCPWRVEVGRVDPGTCGHRGERRDAAGRLIHLRGQTGPPSSRPRVR